MKKIIYLFGIVALLTACNGNKTTKEPAQQDELEMPNDANDNMQRNMNEDTIMEEPADTSMMTPVQ